MVIEDEGALIRTALKGQHGDMIGPGTAVHEDQRIALPDGFDEQGDSAHWHVWH
jgi:hypothetical protein